MGHEHGRERHSHGVADEGRVLQAVLGEKRGDILGHGGIVVPRGMRRLPVVAQVLACRVVRRGLHRATTAVTVVVVVSVVSLGCRHGVPGPGQELFRAEQWWSAAVFLHMLRAFECFLRNNRKKVITA